MGESSIDDMYNVKEKNNKKFFIAYFYLRFSIILNTTKD